MNIKSWFGKGHQYRGHGGIKLHSMALEHSTACMMIVEQSRNILYANKALLQMLKGIEAEIRKSVVQFSVANLINNSLDIFHHNPTQLQNLFSRLLGSHLEEVCLAGQTFQWTMTPLLDSQNQLQAVAIEWQDITALKKPGILSASLLSVVATSSSNIMLADAQRNIVYVNQSLEKTYRALEADIQRAIPNFSATQILGRHIDSFFPPAAGQHRTATEHKAQLIHHVEYAERSFRYTINAVCNDQGERLGFLVEVLERTQEVVTEHQLSHLQGTLDNTSTNVMIADNDRKIIYMNKAVESMLRRVETDLKQALPHFAVDRVIGSNIDIFHKNPAHQMHLLANLTQTYTANIQVGKLHFRLIANPIFAANGQRAGSVVEWLDRTLEVAVENEISQVMAAASNGDFSARIDVNNKSDFFLKLTQGLNQLLSTTDAGLNEIIVVLSAIANGDLTDRVTSEYQGSFRALKDGCNQTADNLLQMLGEIRSAVESINTASSEITQGNIDLSSRTEQQASNLEETAASMEELTGTVRQNADNARQANILAAKASDVAVEGGELIDKVVLTMASINESSQKIADIIGVIDGIAFQTNILALNAAVEAARAGEQGRGFAVVASEVRTLAQRSANAAKDIKALISDSVHKIQNGNELVGKSGNTMKDIVTSIKRVNDIMAEIAAASSEQSAGLDEVGTAVTQMDEMTQQNAALVEQAAAAAESLLLQSEQLAMNVARFKLGDEPAQVSKKPVVGGKAEARAAVAKTAAKSVTKSVTKSVVKPVAAKPMPKPTGKLLKPTASDEDEWESF